MSGSSSHGGGSVRTSRSSLSSFSRAVQIQSADPVSGCRCAGRAGAEGVRGGFHHRQVKDVGWWLDVDRVAVVDLYVWAGLVGGVDVVVLGGDGVEVCLTPPRRSTLVVLFLNLELDRTPHASQHGLAREAGNQRVSIRVEVARNASPPSNGTAPLRASRPRRVHPHNPPRTRRHQLQRTLPPDGAHPPILQTHRHRRKRAPSNALGRILCRGREWAGCSSARASRSRPTGMTPVGLSSSPAGKCATDLGRLLARVLLRPGIRVPIPQ